MKSFAFVNKISHSSGIFLCIHREPMILACDIAFVRPVMHTRLIVTSIPILESIRLQPGCQRQDLISQTNAKDGLDILFLQASSKTSDESGAHFGVSGSVTEEETVEVLLHLFVDGMVPWD